MALNKSKWITLVIAISFAILQALQPFIHAHLDVDHPIQHTGFHVGGEHEEPPANFLYHTDNHGVSNTAHISHTVSVPSGMKEDFNPALVAEILFAVLHSLCFAIALFSTLKFYPTLSLIPDRSLRRRLPASRAPPQF